MASTAGSPARIRTWFAPSIHSPSTRGNGSTTVIKRDYACEIIRSGLAITLLLDKIPPIPSNLIAQGVAGGVSLTWRQSPAMDFIGYNIYRRSLPEAGYTRRNADPVDHLHRLLPSLLLRELLVKDEDFRHLVPAKSSGAPTTLSMLNLRYSFLSGTPCVNTTIAPMIAVPCVLEIS